MAFAAPILPYVLAGSTAIQGISGYQSMQYQGAVARANAQAAQETAKREVAAANADMQDRDLAARQEIDAMMAQLGASGLSVNSGSMLLRRVSAENLATRDRERLGQKRDVALKNTKQQEASFLAEASATSRAAGTSLLTSLLAVPSSYLSGASMVNQFNAGRMSLNNPSYM